MLTLFDNIFQLLIKDRKLSPQVTETQMTEILLTLPNVKVTYDVKKKVVKSISINRYCNMCVIKSTANLSMSKKPLYHKGYLK